MVVLNGLEYAVLLSAFLRKTQREMTHFMVTSKYEYLKVRFHIVYRFI